MQWLTDNWFLVLLGGGMVAMHLFHGHGGHGGHGSHGSHGSSGDPKTFADDSAAEPVEGSTDKSAGTARLEE